MGILSEPIAFITILSGKRSGERLEIKSSDFSVGRGKDCSLRLKEDPYVSRRHCLIRFEAEELILEDLNSANGTFLNGKRIKNSVKLILPAMIIVGHTRMGITSAPATEEEITSFIESTFSAEGSILIPPSSFFQERTEAFFVVDLVGSTSILKQKEIHLSKIVTAMGLILDRTLQKEPEPFLKCTGDGFFACFNTAEGALKAAVGLTPALIKHISVPAKVSIALHWGASYLTAEGDRTGKDVHGVFALEDLRHTEIAMGRILAAPEVRDLILMTEPFWLQLKNSLRMQTAFLGEHLLKGLEEKIQIFQWLGKSSS